jgi:hypothetical protein
MPRKCRTLLHFTALETKFTWEDGTQYKYYENDKLAYHCIFINTAVLSFIVPSTIPQPSRKILLQYAMMNLLLASAPGMICFAHTAMPMFYAFPIL